jgi:hypothetical protein
VEEKGYGRKGENRKQKAESRKTEGHSKRQ